MSRHASASHVLAVARWLRGYFADSGSANEDIIRRYVRDQDKVACKDEAQQMMWDMQSH